MSIEDAFPAAKQANLDRRRLDLVRAATECQDLETLDRALELFKASAQADPSPAVKDAYNSRSGFPNKIKAIKQYRQETGVGLLEAKNRIELWAEEGRL